MKPDNFANSLVVRNSRVVALGKEVVEGGDNKTTVEAECVELLDHVGLSPVSIEPATYVIWELPSSELSSGTVHETIVGTQELLEEREQRVPLHVSHLELGLI